MLRMKQIDKGKMASRDSYKCEHLRCLEPSNQPSLLVAPEKPFSWSEMNLSSNINWYQGHIQCSVPQQAYFGALKQLK